MEGFDELISRQFREWEVRGRGGQLFSRPVALEPPFVPFTGYRLPRHEDDGRKSTLLSSFWNRLSADSTESGLDEDGCLAPAPCFRNPVNHTELQLILPETKQLSSSYFERWLHQVCRAGQAFAFEVLATGREIVPQLSGPPAVIERVDRAIPDLMPAVTGLSSVDALTRAWQESGDHFATVTLSLGREFFIPLSGKNADLLSAVVNAVDCLGAEELALYQVLLEPATSEWAESIEPLIVGADGRPIFSNRPELVVAAGRKLASVLLAVVVRFAACANHAERCWEIIGDMAAPFGALAERRGNFLIPLSNEGYSAAEQEEDLLDRASRRSGMLLNVDELLPFISFPTASRSPRLRRMHSRSRAVPEDLKFAGSSLLGTNVHLGRSSGVWLSTSHRVRHTHLIGTSGMGKSTLLFNLIRQDIENGEGLAVFDPHGDLIESVLGSIPAGRHDDVVLIDPSDEEHIIGFNILAAHSDLERNLLASDLVGIFRRLSTSWGEQMNSVLRNAILAFLESPAGGTLADLRRFLLDGGFRNKFLRTVTDPDIVFYWQRAFPQLTGNKSIGPVLTRLDEFLSRKPIRYMVSQRENRIDFAEILGRGKILLVKLPQGQIGRENSHLLGSIFVSKLQQAAMSRQQLPQSERRDFWVYLDECHNFITPSVAEILTGARKYRVGLVLAHQELHQLEADRDVASAVLANCCTRIAFRVSDRDARELANGFAHFESSDLQKLGVGHAICRIEKSDADFNLSITEEHPSDLEEAQRIRQQVIARSNAQYARLRTDIEAELLRAREAEDPPEPPTERKKPATSRPPPEPSQASTEVPEDIVAPVAVEPRSEAALSGPPASPVQTETGRPPKDLGRGGAQHKAVQERIKLAAEALGFRTTIEKEILGRRGSIDLVLERGEYVLACEVSVTTTIDHEVGNVSKCFKARLPSVAVIAIEEERLQKIKAAVQNSLGPQIATRTSYFLPDQFIEFLSTVPEAAPQAPPAEEVRRGYKVKRKVVSLSAEERSAREQEALRVIAESLRSKLKTSE